MSIISLTIRICESNISRFFVYIVHKMQGHIHIKILHTLRKTRIIHISLFLLSISIQNLKIHIGITVFYLDKCASNVISVVTVAVMSIPIQHIQKTSESTHSKWLIGCFLFKLPFLFTSTTQLREVRIKGRLQLVELKKKHSMKKTLAIVRLNNSLFIFV